MPPDKTTPKTLIRMGAAHYDLTVTPPSGDAIELDLTKAKWRDKGQMAAQLCAAYGITGTSPTNSKTKGKNHHGKHPRRHKPAGQLPGEKALRQAEANDGPKKRSRRRRPSGTVPASGPAAA